MKTEEVFSFKAIIERDEDSNRWVGRCLELDLVTEAKTPGLVSLYLSDIIFSQLEYSFQHDNLQHLYFPSELKEWIKFFSYEKTVIDVFHKDSIKFEGIEFNTVIRIQRPYIVDSGVYVTFNLDKEGYLVK